MMKINHHSDWPIHTGLWRPQPSHPCPCCSYDGLHPRGQDHRIPLWAAEEMPEGRRPICEEDGCCVCRQTPRYQCPAGGGPRLPGHPERPNLRLQPHGKTACWTDRSVTQGDTAGCTSQLWLSVISPVLANKYPTWCQSGGPCCDLCVIS